MLQNRFTYFKSLIPGKFILEIIISPGTYIFKTLNMYTRINKNAIKSLLMGILHLQ